MTDQIRAAYDFVAQQYAEKFSDELEHKPFDRERLLDFVAAVGSGQICDLGCGPGQTTAFLHNNGAAVQGMDLSPELLRCARERHPHIRFDEADMLALPLDHASVGGVLAFYSIVHFSRAELRRALEEMHRVLTPGGLLLLAFHVGDEVVHVEEFLGRPVSLDFVLFPPALVESVLREIGFNEVDVFQRDPYPDVEVPTRRAYLLARKADGVPLVAR